MKYCTKCGKELQDEVVVCPGCGCWADRKTENNTVSQKLNSKDEDRESARLAVAAFILAFFVPVVGTITGIIGASNYRNERFKSLCGWAIAISLILPLISVVMLVLS